MLGVSTFGAAIVVDALGTAVKVAGALVVAAQDTTLLLELVNAHWRQGGGAVDLGGFVMDLMNRDGGVHDLGLDNFLLDDGLDSLVDVAREDILATAVTECVTSTY